VARIETVKVPNIGEFDQVDVVEVLISLGDRVSEGDSLITLESDKASLDVPSPLSGVVEEVLVAVDDKVSEGTPIAKLRLEDGVTGDAEARLSSGEDRESAREESMSDDMRGAAAPKPPPSQPPAPTVTEFPVGAADAEMSGLLAPGLSSIVTPGSEATGIKPHASPSVRRFARELGVDLDRVEPSGPKNRILKDDVAGLVKAELSRPTPTAQPQAVSGGALPEIPAVDFAKFGEIEEVPLSKIKKLTARNMHRAWLNVPMVTQFDEADVTDLESFRKAQKDEATQRGVKLSPLAFLIPACARALRMFPQFNSSLDPSGETLILKKYINIAVAVDTPKGLVVPVIRDADHKGAFELAAELAEMSARARDGKSRLDEFQGATFTISSLGGIGGTAFTPIVNAPEVAILGVSRMAWKQVWRDGGFVPRQMLPLSLTYDHRVIDGADAARFTTYLGELLGDIRKILL
jgi:pyruvate dehydrogenase E2 component (dihydrolipoamide acetyltransferase)